MPQKVPVKPTATVRITPTKTIQITYAIKIILKKAPINYPQLARLESEKKRAEGDKLLGHISCGINISTNKPPVFNI